eukprot:2853485-Rhodomonas_salina.2
MCCSAARCCDEMNLGGPKARAAALYSSPMRGSPAGMSAEIKRRSCANMLTAHVVETVELRRRADVSDKRRGGVASREHVFDVSGESDAEVR